MSVEAVSIIDSNTFDLNNDLHDRIKNALPPHFLRGLVLLIAQYSRLPFSYPISEIRQWNIRANPVEAISITWVAGVASLLLYSKRPHERDLLLVISPESQNFTRLTLNQNLVGRCRHITTHQHEDHESYFFLHAMRISHYVRSGNKLYKIQSFDCHTYCSYDRASDKLICGNQKWICTWGEDGYETFPLTNSLSSIFEVGRSQLIVHKQSPNNLDIEDCLVVTIDDWTPTVRTTLLEWDRFRSSSEYCVKNFVVDPTRTFLFVSALYLEYRKSYCGGKKTFKSATAICMVYNLKDFSKITTLRTKRKCHDRHSWWDVRASANPNTVGLLSISPVRHNEATIDLWHSVSWLHLTTVEIKNDLVFYGDIFFELGTECVIVGSNNRADLKFQHSVILFNEPGQRG